MNRSESIKHIAKALSKAQSELMGAVKDSTNPHFRSNYADLESIMLSLKEPLFNNGLSVSQLLVYDSIPMLETILMHESGEWISSVTPIVYTKQNDPQSYGAGITYVRRFAISAICGVYQTDDQDGNTLPKAPIPSPVKEKTKSEKQTVTIGPPAGTEAEFIKENKARIDKNSFVATMPAETPGPHGVCTFCGANRNLSAKGDFLYCPNFKDPVNGKKHPTVPFVQKPLTAKNNMPMFEDDVP